MARKQSEWLNDLLSDDDNEAASPEQGRTERARGTTLLGRENAISRVASGEVRHVTQLLLNPDRVRVWPGNERAYEHLSEENCRELIDSLIAEGGQKVPAVVRKVEDDPEHDYEVIAGTRRHWSISWLRRNSYPEIQFLAQVVTLDDEAAFRLADIENRARKDVSDLERARNYAAALVTHYDGHLTRMAERLKLSKGWLSKMIRVASLPDEVIAAFSSPTEVQLKPAYALAQSMADDQNAKAIVEEAGRIAKEQDRLRDEASSPLNASEVMQRLLNATQESSVLSQPIEMVGTDGRAIVSVKSVGRSGITLRIRRDSGMQGRQIGAMVAEVLDKIEGRKVTHANAADPKVE